MALIFYYWNVFSIQNENTYCFVSIKRLLTKSFKRKAAKAAIFLPLSCVSRAVNKRTFQVTALHLKREKSLRRLLSVNPADQMAKAPPEPSRGAAPASLCSPSAGRQHQVRHQKVQTWLCVKFGLFQNTCLISWAWCLPALALTFSQLCAQQKWLFHLRDLGKRLKLQTVSPNLTQAPRYKPIPFPCCINHPIVPG